MVLNVIGFNLIWFGLVYWGNMFIPLAVLALTLHLRFLSTNKNEVKLIFAITIIGIIVDSLLKLTGVFMFYESVQIPFWLITLWACFAATICHSLSFLNSSKTRQLLIGGALSPLSYIAGEKLDAVEFGQSMLDTYMILAVIWAVLFLLFFKLKSFLVDAEVKHA